MKERQKKDFNEKSSKMFINLKIFKERIKSNLNEAKCKSANSKIITKKSIISIISAIAILITVLFSYFLKEKTNKMLNADPELLRAINYEQFGDGDDAVYVNGTQGTGSEQIVDNIKFSSFFLRDLDGDGYAEKIKGTCKEIGGEDTLYMEIIVQTEGYLKNAKIQIDEKNFYFQTALPKDNELKANYIGNNIQQIEFENLNNGTQKMLTGVVRSGDYSYESTKINALGNNKNNYTRNDNKVILTGTYVTGDGTETEIRKEMPLTMDWYGTATTTINSLNQTVDTLPECIDSENDVINLSFNVQVAETNNKLLLSKNYVEGTIPELNGYAPESVTLTDGGGILEYNDNTRKFTITKEAVTNENGDLTSIAYSNYNGVSRENKYTVKVTYPLEAYESLGQESVTISIPIETYYEGYNNTNSEFTNPYKSNTARETIVTTYRNPQGTAARFEVKVGKYVSSPVGRQIVSKRKPLKIYNGISSEETDDTYVVQWRGLTGTNGETSGMVMKETKDEEPQVIDRFIKNDSTEDTMENIVANKGIWLTYAEGLVGEEGWIKVYDDETDDLLVTFTKNGVDGSKKWDQYTEANPYYYSVPVKHVRIETSSTKAGSEINVFNLKELDDTYITENYTKEGFDSLNHIKSTIVGYLGEVYVNQHDATAIYEEPYVIADIEISKNILSTQITEENFLLSIKAEADEYTNKDGWVNGTFLVKLPDEILTTDINSVNINNSTVRITSYEIIEKDGHKFIKIKTSNQNPASYTISLNLNITPDPRIASTSKQFELYAINEETENYYYNTQDIYDIDEDGNITELVNSRNVSISLIAPNSLLTNQTMSEFDASGTVIVSPQIADLKPIYDENDRDPQTVKIGVQMKNNYAGTISEAKIIGKIPFAGNTYVVSERDLDSDFTTEMLNTGVEVPTELLNDVTVYYSENENPNRDLSDTTNGWTLKSNVTDWSKIKTYLIDLEDTIIGQGAEYTFYYVIKIPFGLDFNEIAYSHHGIYFSLDTPEGKYRTSTEPNKIGVRIADKYNLELTKYQMNKNRNIEGAIYKVSRLNSSGEVESSSTAITNAQGKLEMANLYGETRYEISEISTPTNYELSGDVIGIIGHINRETGTLTIEKLYGETRSNITVVKNEGEDYKAKVEVEDEARASLKIVKKDESTNNPIRGVKYRLTGTGFPLNGKTVTTNVNGEITVNGIRVGEEYTLEETKAGGYYLARNFIFKVINNEGTYKLQAKDEDGNFYDLNSIGEYTVEVDDGQGGTVNETREVESLKSSAMTENEDLPIINLGFVNEKIPTYNIEITKIKHVTELEGTSGGAGNGGGDTPEITYLQGAKFKLYKDGKELGTYTTDANGKITIEGLYQYVEEKGVEQTYILKETLAPEGYSKVKDIVFNVEEVTEEVDNGEGGTSTVTSLRLNQILEEGQSDSKYTVDGNTIKLTVEDNPSFKLIKKDGETNELIANTKFAIYNVDTVQMPARNSKGEIVGEKETINGQEYYTVTTDSNGEITVDLPEGMYKAVEVEANEKYDLSSNNEYYFGISTNREEKRVINTEWGVVIGGGADYSTDIEEIYCLKETSDGGFVAVGKSYTDFSIGGIQVDLNRYSDGIIIKYNKEDEVEWAKAFGGIGWDRYEAVTETSDGGIVAIGWFTNNIVLDGVTYPTKGSSDSVIVKYAPDGEIEWFKTVGGTGKDLLNSISATSDGGFIIGGNSTGSINFDEDSIINYGDTDGFIIKCSEDGIVEWSKNIGGVGTDSIQSVVATSDNYIIAGGNFSSSINLENNTILTSNGTTDSLVLKLDIDGNIEWTKTIGGTGDDDIIAVNETSDGKILAGGYFSNDINLGNGKSITSKGDRDGLLVKLSAEGNIESIRGIGGNSNESIRSLEETSDKGIIVTGNFASSPIDFEEGFSITSTGDVDIMIIKYNEEDKVEWIETLGGTREECVNTIIENKPNEYYYGGWFQSSRITLSNDDILSNRGNRDGMLIKITERVIPDLVVKKAESIGGTYDDKINSVAETTDGGYIVGGQIKSRITVGEYTLSCKGSSDGVIIKYNSIGEVEWANTLGGTNDDEITSIAETTDGGYIAGGYFYGSITVGGNTLTSKGSSDGLMIKYSSSGEVEWVETIGGTGADRINSLDVTSSGGYIVGGHFTNTIEKEGYTLTSKGASDGMIIKYSQIGKVEWIKTTGNTYSDTINSVEATLDGGYIVGGYSYLSYPASGGIVYLDRINSEGIIIKYSKTGEVEWTREIGGSSYESINSISQTSDGGYIVGGSFYSSSFTLGKYTLANHGSSSHSDGMIIKYNDKGEVEWAESIGGSGNGQDDIKVASSTKDRRLYSRRKYLWEHY